MAIATQRLAERDDITDVGQGTTYDGDAAVMVFMSDATSITEISHELDGIPVLFTITDHVKAQ